MEEILLNKPGKKIILLGNEAIVRGGLEEGVNFVSTYPGTPASEIGNIFNQIAKKIGVYFEFSTNEKVALEAGIGASFAGLKTLVAMKNFGLNVALDSLLPFCYTGTKGPAVIVVADDPSCHSSAQSEENSRFIAETAHIPVLEPSDPQECKDFVRLGFQISEKYKIPVIVRTTTRVAHQKMPVKFDKITRPGNGVGKFVKEPKRFVTLPPRVLEQKKELLEKIEKIREFSEKSKINFQSDKKNALAQKFPMGIITSGISYLYVMEALKELNLSLPVLKLGFFYPLPEEKIKDFIKNFKKVLIVEELEPYLEREVERLAKDINPKLQIFGKTLLPETGELKPEQVILALAKFTGKKYKKLPITSYQLPKIKHLPRFCPGCPYWSVFAAVKKVAPKDTVFGGDIGCYMLAGTPAIAAQDYLSAMGSSVGIAHGIARTVKKQKTITFIGDSTFFHAGIPALINTVFNKSNPLIIILDNGTTAMTGHQPHPGTSVRTDSEYKFEWDQRDKSLLSPPLRSEEGDPSSLETKERPLQIEKIVAGCGVKNLKVVNSFDLKAIEKAVEEFLPKKETSVIIARGICALLRKHLPK
ncbi:MAG: thiamine pyrophosphate-dependent enzyme [Patescibacteria group bacterium]|nr:thiamine pyrophosphate-dependent enzyme [Patescibacteria group bacterium]